MNSYVHVGIITLTLPHQKNLLLKSTMFQHRDIHIYTWTSLDGKMGG